MKQLILFFALITGLPVFAQDFKTDTFIVKKRVLNRFVKKCKALDTLGFNMQAYSSLFLTPRTDNPFPLNSVRNKEYSLPYKGDQYRFEKAFGIFPENELLKTIDQYKKKTYRLFRRFIQWVYYKEEMYTLPHFMVPN